MLIGAFLFITVVFWLSVQSFIILGPSLLVGTGTFSVGIASLFYVAVSSVIATMVALIGGIII